MFGPWRAAILARTARREEGARSLSMRILRCTPLISVLRLVKTFHGTPDLTEKSKSCVRASFREAFNSPFWPFVLATTSVGQEGLDFHLYCHAVAHWNLPSNPVDMEQREGRVHRFKGHAVRKNIAQQHRHSADPALGGDRWTAM